MTAEDNIKTIQALYEAFGRGDLVFILESVSDDVDWATVASSHGAPWYGPHTGRDGVADFFRQFGSAMEVKEFIPRTFAANETDVFAVVFCHAVARATGEAMKQELHHLFRFRDGKIVYYRGTEDTAQTEAALSS